MTPKDLRQALPLFTEFLDRFTPLFVEDKRSESRRDRADAYLRGLLLDAESTKTAEAIALKVHGDPSQVRMTQVFLGQSPWADDPLRQELACWVDESGVYRTKPELALELIRSVGRKVRHGWVTFDEGYGKDPGFLSGLEELDERYIGEVPKSFRGWLRRPKVEEPKPARSGRPRRKPRVRAGEPAPQTVEEIAASLPSTAWKRL